MVVIMGASGEPTPRPELSGSLFNVPFNMIPQAVQQMGGFMGGNLQLPAGGIHAPSHAHP